MLILTPDEIENEHAGLVAQIAGELSDPAVQRQVVASHNHTELIALLRAETVAEG